jgi:hypothetical protein
MATLSRQRRQMVACKAPSRRPKGTMYVPGLGTNERDQIDVRFFWPKILQQQLTGAI